jgi:hypothetical protein
MSRKQGPRYAGMRPSAIAQVLRHTAHCKPFQVKE